MDKGSGAESRAASPADAPRRAPLTREELDYALNAIGPRRRAFNTAVTGSYNAVSGAFTSLTEWLRRRWLTVVNTTLGVYVGLAVLTPVGYMLGLDGPSSAIFRAYRIACDELPTHSFFIGGYQMCLCARCLAIYSTMLLSGLLLAALRRRGIAPRGINFLVWALAALPMALDGGTQLFGLRESNPGLRLLTGALFGLATAWFALPQLASAADDERVAARVAPAYQRLASPQA